MKSSSLIKSSPNLSWKNSGLSEVDSIDFLKEKNSEIENLQKTILQIQNNMLELQKRHNSDL